MTKLTKDQKRKIDDEINTGIIPFYDQLPNHIQLRIDEDIAIMKTGTYKEQKIGVKKIREQTKAYFKNQFSNVNALLNLIQKEEKLELKKITAQKKREKKKEEQERQNMRTEIVLTTVQNPKTGSKTYNYTSRINHKIFNGNFSFEDILKAVTENAVDGYIDIKQNQHLLDLGTNVVGNIIKSFVDTYLNTANKFAVIVWGNFGKLTLERRYWTADQLQTLEPAQIYHELMNEYRASDLYMISFYAA